MRYTWTLACFLAFASVAVAQTDSGISLPPSSTSGTNVPAATTGTAPIDSGVPSGTGTTGTSGTTMEQAERNNESNRSFVWVILAAALVAGLIVLSRNKRRSKQR